jgi:tRNA G18 (ribose-2'-O)-methylase SpoU
MRVVHVDDPSDPRVREYVGLRDPILRRAYELPGAHGAGVFIAEGRLVIERLLRSPYPLRSVLVTPERLERLRPALEAAGADEVYVAGQDVLNLLTGYDLHMGAVASASRLPPSAASDLLRDATTVAVLEGLNDPENLGAIIRSASALGVQALLLDPTCVDPLYRRVVRVSMGETLFLRHARLEPWPGGIQAVRDAGLQLVALTPDEHAIPIEAWAADAPARIALLLGAELTGLSDAALAAADVLVRIPIAGGADSLNVGHAAAIAFHSARMRPGCGGR